METIQNAINYVTESIAGTGAEASKEANKEIAKDSNQSLGTRAEAAVDAVGDKIDETKHNAKAEGHKEQVKHDGGILSHPIESLQHGINYVAESVAGSGAEASKEVNKEIAKDSNQSIGTRLGAAVDAVGDKIDESKHNAKAEGHKKMI